VEGSRVTIRRLEDEEEDGDEDEGCEEVRK
jgi:hypothetical protein